MKKLTKLNKQFLILLIINILSFSIFSKNFAKHFFIVSFSLYFINSIAYKKLKRKTKILLAILTISIGSIMYIFIKGISCDICFYLFGMFGFSYEKKIFHKKKVK
jgi:hypothetical protein